MDSESLLPPPSLPTAPNNNLFTISTLSTRGILLRAVTMFSLVALSLWANYEASKGFDLTIRNASKDTVAGRRFNLMFVSNGKAAKLLLESSDFIERILYPGNLYVKKPVRHVILELAGVNTTELVQVACSSNKENQEEYLILVTPDILEEANATVAMAAALYKAMAYVWLWDGTTSTQRNIVDAMVEYLMLQSGLYSMSCENINSSVSSFLQRCESLSNGFVACLNNAMHDQFWSERMVQKHQINCLKSYASSISY